MSRAGSGLAAVRRGVARGGWRAATLPRQDVAGAGTPRRPGCSRYVVGKNRDKLTQNHTLGGHERADCNSPPG